MVKSAAGNPCEKKAEVVVLMKVNNRQVVRELAWMTYKAEKKRNVFFVIAVGMASFLIAVMAATGSAYWHTLTERQLRMQGIDYDISLGEPTQEQIEIVRAMEKVKHAGMSVACMEVEQFEDRAIDEADFFWLDAVCWEKQTMPALESYTGHYPQQEDELMLSQALLSAMHVTQPQIGMKLQLTYHTLAKDDSGVMVREFTLCGWFLDYTGKEKGYVSKAFFDASGVKQTDMGRGALRISLVNPLYLPKDIAEMNQAVGISGTQRISADHSAVVRFCKIMAALAAMLFMVLASAYLFVYNVMYLSIAKNIRYYGQLKTIGTTGLQLRGIVYRQALWNAVMGIAAGIAGAVFVSKTVVPEILFALEGAYEKEQVVPVGPATFLAAGLFTLLVNLVSCGKPAKIAAEASPIEAMRYQAVKAKGNMQGKTRGRETGTLPAMAFQNMFRDKKQAVVIFLSSAVSVAVFFTVNVVIYGNDAKHILEERGGSDVQILNQTTLRNRERQIFTKEIMAELTALEGVETIRSVSSAEVWIPWQEEVFADYYKALYASQNSPGDYETDIGRYQADETDSWVRQMFGTRLIGIDEAGFDKLNESLGFVLDRQAFENGETAVTTEQIFAPGDFDMAGKTVRFLLPQGIEPDMEYSVRIAAVGKLGDDPRYFSGGYTPQLIVSEAFAEKLLGETFVELIEIDYKQPYSKATEEAVRAVFAEEKKVTFSSKLDVYASMLDTEFRIKALGYGIGGIMAVLALLNYVNLMVAGIQNRARELAMLESIGMTVRQICRMLWMEGTGYGVMSLALSLALGVPFSIVVFQGLAGSVSYEIPLLSTFVLFAVSVALCMTVPVLVYRWTQKADVMERLQKGED
ncbi:hypothetical protein C823_002666 [Eubacterium plexicaudatum ASF492]|uniref:ABC3 transporter permease C-terminal domain-containing protein n=1 Tax=Eubacterium plexicaudatum ASF492 TaxID=1235802 RepID=N2A8L0_9FIRM|nr:hypothetical protein C823_002666 [Eubacterium plexicaudatum ASF492]